MSDECKSSQPRTYQQNTQACTHTYRLLQSPKGSEEWLTIFLVLGKRELVKTMAGSFFLALPTAAELEWGKSECKCSSCGKLHGLPLGSLPEISSMWLSHPTTATRFIIHLMQTHTPALVHASPCCPIPHLSAIPIKTYWERLSISCSERQTTLSLKLIRTSLSPPTAHIAMETQPRVVTWYWQNRRDAHRERGRGMRFPSLQSDPWFWALLQPPSWPSLHSMGRMYVKKVAKPCTLLLLHSISIKWA